MAMQSFTTKEALLTKQSTCSMSHVFKAKGNGKLFFQISSIPPAVGASTPKSQKSSPHCVKGFADDLTIISLHEHDYVSVFRTVSKKCSNIDLELRLDKCVSVVYNGSKVKKICSFSMEKAT